MKPTYRLSGDQKGVEAPSVPGRRRHSSASRSRSHNPPAVNTSLRPSGDTDTSLYEVTFSGTGASNRPGEPGAVGWNTHTLIPNAIAAINTANPCHTRTDREGIDGSGCAAINLSACLTSRADCQRFP